MEYLDRKTFNDLKNLRRIHLNDNHLEIIDQDLFQGLEKLTFLFLMSNDIKQLHRNTFNGLVNLKVGLLNILNNKNYNFTTYLCLKRKYICEIIS